METNGYYNSSGDVALEVKHLSKSFDGNPVLKDINLSVSKGENLAVLGKSGAGKSVLIKCIVRLIDPDSGHVSMLGKDTVMLEGKELNELRKKTGFLFQGAALYDSMTVRENLAFPLRDLGRSERKNTELRVKEALDQVGLYEIIDKMPSELSGGMKKRVGLARSLMLKPEIMFYDEPTTGLDTITVKEISKLILDVQKKQGATSIIITHDLQCARLTANRIVVLNDGICAAEGSYEELEKSEDEWVRSFFE